MQIKKITYLIMTAAVSLLAACHPAKLSTADARLCALADKQEK